MSTLCHNFTTATQYTDKERLKYYAYELGYGFCYCADKTVGCSSRQLFLQDMKNLRITEFLDIAHRPVF
jgi:hypothetical protein